MLREFSDRPESVTIDKEGGYYRGREDAELYFRRIYVFWLLGL